MSPEFGWWEQDRVNDVVRLLERLVDAAERIADAAEIANEDDEDEGE